MNNTIEDEIMNNKISEEDKSLMKKYGITHTNKVVYQYKDYHYTNLTDAINYAKSREDKDIAASKAPIL